MPLCMVEYLSVNPVHCSGEEVRGLVSLDWWAWVGSLCTRMVTGGVSYYNKNAPRSSPAVIHPPALNDRRNRMSKDIQGMRRGKCNTCEECEEYIPPKEGHGARCDYCDHTPVEHVRMIKLGGCTSCGEEECEEYISSKQNSYTECQYCGCHASVHQGAEKCYL